MEKSVNVNISDTFQATRKTSRSHATAGNATGAPAVTWEPETRAFISFSKTAFYGAPPAHTPSAWNVSWSLAFHPALR